MAQSFALGLPSARNGSIGIPQFFLKVAGYEKVNLAMELS
jgi:hypothetical protein